MKIVISTLFVFFGLYAFSQTPLTGEVGGQTLTKTNSPYVIDGSVTVSTGTTLTVEAGVEVQSRKYDDLLAIYGTLLVKGTAQDSVKFNGFANTGYNANSLHGGGIIFVVGSLANKISYTSFNNMGDIHATPYTIEIEAADVSITNSSFRGSGSTAININVQNSSPVINNVSFSNNGLNISGMPSGMGGISNCTNTAINVQYEDIFQSCIIPYPGSGSYYILAGNGFHVQNNAKVTISPGVQIQSHYYTDVIMVDGTLVAKGTQSDSIRFIGFANTAANPNSSHGGQIDFTPGSVNSILQYAVIERMGDAQGVSTAVQINSSSLSILNSSIRNSEGPAITIGEQNITPTISSVSFSNDYKPIVSPVSSVSGITNCPGIAIYLSYENIYSNCTISNPGANSFYILDGRGFEVGANAKLTIAAGTEIQSHNYTDYIQVDGTLIAKGTASDSIRFTGFADLTVNSNSTHGGGIYFNPGSVNSVLQYVAVVKMGDVQGVGGIAVSVMSSSVSIANSNFRDCEGTALVINQSNITPAITNCSFSGNAAAITSFPSGTGNISNCPNIAINLYNENITTNCTIANPGKNSFYLLQGNGFGIGSNVKLTIASGTEIQSHNYSDVIEIDGTLIAKGSPGDSIRFTGFTNAAVNVNSTHGGSLQFSSSSVNSVLQYVVLDRMGDANTTSGAVYVSTSSISISNSNTRNAEKTGIHVEDGYSPSIFSNVFFNNTWDIYAGAGSCTNIHDNPNTQVVITNTIMGNNATWPAPGEGSKYVVGGDITIPASITLTVDQGSQIYFGASSFSFYVYGSFKVNGSKTAPVLFTQTQGGFSNSIYIMPGSVNSVLQHTSLQKLNSLPTLSTASLVIQSTSLLLDDVTVSNSPNTGVLIYVDNADSVKLSGITVNNNLYGVSVQTGNIKLINCSIYDNTKYGVLNTGDDTVDARNCYWGDTTGPYHPTLNKKGKGNQVSDAVKFIPWNNTGIKTEQQIFIDSIVDKHPADTVILQAKASSGLAVTYNITTLPAVNVAVLRGDTILFLGDTGRIVVNITQAGNASYAVAEIQKSFRVIKNPQTINFAALPAKISADTGTVLHASASSFLPVSFSISEGPATIDKNNKVIITGSGNIVVKANQTGNKSYYPAPSIQRNFTGILRTPDVAVDAVTSDKAIISPGDNVKVSWRVSNKGTLKCTANWQENIYMQSTAGDNKTLLKQKSYTGAVVLDTGKFINRVDTVVIPQQLIIGDKGVFAIEIVPDTSIKEAPDADGNNIGVQNTAWAINKILTLQADGNILTEGDDSSVNVTISRTGSIQDSLVVNTGITQAGRFLLPRTITIPAGQVAVYLNVQVKNDAVVQGTVIDTLSVSAKNFTASFIKITVVDDDKASLSIVNLPATAKEGETVVFKISASPVSPKSLQVFLSTGSQQRFPLPPFVTIPADSASATVTLVLEQDTIPEIDLPVTISAGADGLNAATDTIMVTDDDVPGLELVLPVNSVAESAGTNAITATLRRKANSSKVAFTTYLSADVPGVLILPGSATLGAGENEKTFDIGTIDNAIVDGDKKVNITASIFVESCSCTASATKAGSVSTSLTVTDDDGPALTVTPSQQTVSEGTAGTVVLHITTNKVSDKALVVHLTSNDTSEAKLPVTATIQAGQSYVDVPVTTINDNISDGNQQVYFQATADGFATATTWIIVTDLNKPDLQVASVTVNNPSVQQSALFSYTVSVKNTGFATAISGAVIKGYLSKDNILDGSDSVISEDIIEAPIPAGQSVNVVNAKKAPGIPGQYNLLFQVNPDTSISELLFNNNTSQPIALTVKPAYTATARVGSTYFIKGTTIPIAGAALNTDGTVAANVPVEVYVIINGIRRQMQATTDVAGHFNVQFVPMPNEAGRYTIGAGYPGMADTASQGFFDIPGLTINSGSIPQFLTTLNDTLKGSLSIENLSGLALNNFSLKPVTLPYGAVITFDTVKTFNGNSAISLNYIVRGTQLSTGDNYQPVTLQAIAKEGMIESDAAYYFCQSPTAFIAADIEALNITVSKTKGERLTQFSIINKGRTPTGNLQIKLPAVNWINNVTAATLPSIKPGDTGVVVLKFTLAADVPFNQPVTGTVVATAQYGNSFALPFTYTKVADSTGVVKVTATDQFTYYSPGSPSVSNAHVTVSNIYTGQVYADGYTDATGQFFAKGVPEGDNKITVTKDKHDAYTATIVTNAGDTAQSTAFLNYQAIAFDWTVVPTTVQDQYTVTLTTKYETDVPMPVVTVDMPAKMPKLTGNQVFPFTITLTNHGLITAEGIAFEFSLDSEYEFITNYLPTDLAAHQSIQVPVVMRLRTDLSGFRNALYTKGVSNFLDVQITENSLANNTILGCKGLLGLIYQYKCNTLIKLVQRLGIPFDYDRDCPHDAGAGATSGSGGLGGAGITDADWAYIDWWTQWMNNWGNNLPPCVTCGTQQRDPNIDPYKVPEWLTKKTSCDDCLNAIGGALENYIPVLEPILCIAGKIIDKDALGIANCLLKIAVDKAVDKAIERIGEFNTKVAVTNSLGAVDGVIEDLPEDVADKILGKIPIYRLISGVSKIIKALSVCLRVDPSATETKDLRNIRANYISDTSSGFYSNINSNLNNVLIADKVRANWAAEYFGDTLYSSEAYYDFYPLVDSFVDNFIQIPASIQNSILNKMNGYDISPVALNNFFVRWNSSIKAKNAGVMISNSEYPGIINWKMIKSYSDSVADIHNYAIDKGYKSIEGMYNSSVNSLNQLFDQQQQAVCASVTVQFTQQVTMTREGFEGTLNIFNGHPTDKMDSLSVVLQITDENGIPANGLFDIQIKSLINLNNVAGTGFIAAQQKGTADFLFIPGIGAAPKVPVIYRFGGYIRYLDPYKQVMVTMPLAPVPITVNPSPDLMLHYFMQRNILGDDPLTSPAVEPSLPAELAVMVENQGYGEATGLSISSAQPQIVDNEKGLAIDFKLTGSNFQGQPASLGVTDINFGTIPAQQSRIGEWYFTSSLLGKFISYDAKVVHDNSTGNPLLSLVKSVQLHELSKSIKVYGKEDDGINDFLVNDVFDVDDVPDIIYLSQGDRTASVYTATSGSFSSPVQAPSFTNKLTVTPSLKGWNYIKLDDPGKNNYEIASITRADGQVIPLDNAWLTFVTLPVSREPVYENKFHFVDTFGAVSAVVYTVVWKPKNTDVPRVDSIVGAPDKPSAEQVRNITVIFNKAIDPATFTYNDISLSWQGGSNIADASTVITQNNSTTFTIDISKLTTKDGAYNLVVQAAGIKDIYGTSGVDGTQVFWSQFVSVPAVIAFQGIPESDTAASFNTIQLLFNMPLDETTVTPARFTVSKNGQVLNGQIAIDSVSADHKLFYLSGLNTLLAQSGTYQFTVDVKNILSTGHIAGIQLQSIALTVDNTGPSLVLLETSNTGGLDALHNTSVNIKFSKTVYNLSKNAITLSRNGTLLSLDSMVLDSSNRQQWVLTNLGILTYPEGDYIFTVKLDGIQDAAGNKGKGTKQISWIVNRSSLITVTGLTITPDLGFSGTDGVTSSRVITVAFNLSSHAAKIDIVQADEAGGQILLTAQNVTAGNIAYPITLLPGSSVVIKVNATGQNGGAVSAQKTLFIDEQPLLAQWNFSDGQVLTKQADTISFALSAKLIDTSAIAKALTFSKNGIALSTKGLNTHRVNDTLYQVYGISSASNVPAAYQLSIQLDSLAKYSSGKFGSGKTTVSWLVAKNNHAPVAVAGRDTTVLAPGKIMLNGSRSYDADMDSISYKWIAPYGIVLDDSTAVAPSFKVTTANRGKTYTFLLIVSDGTDFNTDDVSVTVSDSITALAVTAKVFLGGAYDAGTGLMQDSLRAKKLISLSNPYTTPAFKLTGNTGSLFVINPALLKTAGNSAVVDWVWLELRDSLQPATIVSSRPALLLRNGYVVDTDGVAPVKFINQADGNYFLVIRHRNHLGVMVAKSVAFNNGKTTTLDFTQPSFGTFGTNSQQRINNVMMFWPGDANEDGNISYNGAANDKNGILAKVGLASPNNSVIGYYNEDCNMDGVVKYNGAHNDKNVVLASAGLSTPNTTIKQQLPK